MHTTPYQESTPGWNPDGSVENWLPMIEYCEWKGYMRRKVLVCAVVHRVGGNSNDPEPQAHVE